MEVLIGPAAGTMTPWGRAAVTAVKTTIAVRKRGIIDLRETEHTRK
jgi:hypothetical protein